MLERLPSLTVICLVFGLLFFIAGPSFDDTLPYATGTGLVLLFIATPILAIITTIQHSRETDKKGEEKGEENFNKTAKVGIGFIIFGVLYSFAFLLSSGGFGYELLISVPAVMLGVILFVIGLLISAFKK